MKKKQKIHKARGYVVVCKYYGSNCGIQEVFFNAHIAKRDFPDKCCEVKPCEINF